MAEIKHVGRIKSTNKKCVVAYRTLPGDAYNCLIVPTESIPDAYHDSLLNLVESNAAQTSYELAEALARTNFPDGTIMLSSLHALGKLVKVPTDQVEMLPAPGVSIQLDELNQLIAAQRGIPVDELSIKPKTEEEPQQKNEVQSNPETPSVVLDTTPSEPVVDENDPVAAAKYYRSQADKLAKQAANFRRMAEDLVPTPKRARGKTQQEDV